jgi:hypothetical protein
VRALSFSVSVWICCTTVGDSGQLTLGGQSAAARARLLRNGRLYALGTAVVMSEDRVKLLLNDRRALAPGHCTLVLLRRRGGRWVTTRQGITIG